MVDDLLFKFEVPFVWDVPGDLVAEGILDQGWDKPMDKTRIMLILKNMADTLHSLGYCECFQPFNQVIRLCSLLVPFLDHLEPLFVKLIRLNWNQAFSQTTARVEGKCFTKEGAVVLLDFDSLFQTLECVFD